MAKSLKKESGKLAMADIEVKKSPIHGYGVFAVKKIPKKTVIEESRAVIFPKLKEYRRAISERIFSWDDNNVALVLGYGSIYNHSSKPNATFSVDRSNEVMKFIAIDDIKSGDEILIDYGERWFANHAQREAQERRKYAIRFYRMFTIILVLLALSFIFPAQKTITKLSQSRHLFRQDVTNAPQLQYLERLGSSSMVPRK